MAYCRHCGAYVPDNHTRCLSCGMDEEDIQSQSQAASQAAQSSTQQEIDRLKKELEEQRRKQQEANRRWAEAEYSQRKKAEAERENMRQGERISPVGSRGYKGSVNNSVNGSVIMAAMSYLGILFLVPLIFAKDDDFAQYHSRQGLMLFISLFVMRIVTGILDIQWVATLATLYFIYKGMMNAINKKREPLPFIGKLFNK